MYNKRMTLYTRDSCAPCKTVKYMLDKLGVDYEIKDVEVEENLTELITKHGATTTPVFVRGDDVVIGANLGRIKQLVS